MIINFFRRVFWREMKDYYMSHLIINLKIGFNLLLALNWLCNPMMLFKLKIIHLSILISNILIYSLVNVLSINLFFQFLYSNFIVFSL